MEQGNKGQFLRGTATKTILGNRDHKKTNFRLWGTGEQANLFHGNIQQGNRYPHPEEPHHSNCGEFSLLTKYNRNKAKYFLSYRFIQYDNLCVIKSYKYLLYVYVVLVIVYLNGVCLCIYLLTRAAVDGKPSQILVFYL